MKPNIPPDTIQPWQPLELIEIDASGEHEVPRTRLGEPEVPKERRQDESTG